MPRPAEIWLRKSDGFWYVTRRGEKVKRSRDEAEAEKAFTLSRTTMWRPPRPLGSPAPARVQRRYLVDLCEFVGNKKAPDVRVTWVKDWVAADKPVTLPSDRGAVRKWVSRPAPRQRPRSSPRVNWAVEELRLAVSPAKGIERGRFKWRERIMPPEHRDQILAVANPCPRDFLSLTVVPAATRRRRRAKSASSYPGRRASSAGWPRRTRRDYSCGRCGATHGRGRRSTGRSSGRRCGRDCRSTRPTTSTGRSSSTGWRRACRRAPPRRRHESAGAGRVTTAPGSRTRPAPGRVGGDQGAGAGGRRPAPGWAGRKWGFSGA